MNKLIKPLLSFALGVLLGGAGIWAALTYAPPSPAPAAAVAISVEQLALRTADGTRLEGILYRPAANPRPTAFLLVHGFGGNYYAGFFPVFAQTAAKQGYASLALNMRDHDTGPKVYNFIDNEADIAVGAAYLRGLDYPRLVLVAHSMGTNRVLYYQAVTGDLSISATVVVAGPGNLFEWNVWQFGREKAQATVDEALKMQAAGQESQLMLIDLGPLGKALYTPRYLLSLRGPQAHSDPYQNIQKVTNPILVIQGAADKLIEPDIADRLQRAATASRRVDLIRIDGADHSFTKQEDVLAERVLAWLPKAAP